MPEKQMTNVTIIDYEAGNLFSVEQACKIVGLIPGITNSPEDILKADALILPGVGAFREAMINLQKLGLVSPLREFIASGKPFFGICLGMQLLFSKSEEFGDCEGLGFIEGSVVRFPSANNNGRKMKVPQIGWNQIFYPSKSKNNWDSTPLEGIRNGELMYFVHSFYASPLNPGDVLAITNYEGVEYCSAVIKDNIFATQFHPEKSAGEGLKIYRYWVSRIKAAGKVG